MRVRQRDYELMFIISPLRSSEEDINNTIGRVQQTITNAGGQISSVEQGPPWGRRKFAYPIRKYAEGEASRRPFTEGYYVLVNFSLPTNQIPEIDRALKLNDAVLRHLLLLVEHKGVAAAPMLTRAGASDDFDDSNEDEEDEDEGEEDEG